MGGGRQGGPTRPNVAQPTMEVMTKAERAHMFGIECAEALVWRKWAAGGEYMKVLNVRNVTAYTQRVTYTLPANHCFGMDYPAPIKLAAGTSITLQVTFRPMVEEVYEDSIEFRVKDGVFHVPIKAVLPYADISAPESLDFGFCAVKQVTTQQFEFTNTGDVAQSYRWRLDAPFALSPESGMLGPKQVQTVTATLKPTTASVFTAHAVCESAEGAELAAVSITAVVKFPYLSVEDGALDFEAVRVGKSVEKVTRLVNPSAVPAEFSVLRTVEDHDGVFSMRPMDGVLQPGEATDVLLSYTPLVAGVATCETFKVVTPGGHTMASIQCSGSAVGATVALSCSSVNFGAVAVGDKSSRIVHVENAGDLPVGWQLVAGAGVFTFDRTQGTCAPAGASHVSVTFAPKEPAACHKRVACVVKDARAPLLLDLCGTGYDDKRRPPELKQMHVNTMYARVAAGLPPMPAEGEEAAPPQLTTMMMDGEEGRGAASTSGLTMAAAAAGPSDAERWLEVFQPDWAKPVSLDKASVSFGACSHLRVADYQQVTVRNAGAQKVTCFWSAPTDAEGVGANEKPRAIFSVFPEQADIKPGGAVTFRVAFRPGRNTFYYAHQLECFAYIKALRHFRGVPEGSVSAPWSMTLTASGNTYTAGDASGMPKVEASSKRVVFPPVQLGQASMTTVALANHSDTPVRFDFADALSGQTGAGSVFTVSPLCGVIAAHAFQLLSLRFAPLSPGRTEEEAACTFNHFAGNVLRLQLVGSGCTPKLRMTPATMYFKPTCLGAVSSRTVSLQNATKLPTHFHFPVPEKLRGAVRIEPSEGTLGPGEAVAVTWTFVPAAQKQYMGRVPCVWAAAVGPRGPLPNTLAEGADGEDWTSSRLTVPVVGEGTQGAVRIEPATLDFGTVLATEAASQELTVHNVSPGNLHFHLRLKAVSATGAEANPTAPLTDVVTLSEAGGTLPARGTKRIKLTFSPPGRCEYVFAVECHTSTTPFDLPTDQPLLLTPTKVLPMGTASSFGGDKDGNISVAPPSTEVIVAADYPVLRVADVYSEGVGKRTLWKQMGMSAVNTQLAAVPSEAERKFRSAERITPVAEVLEALPACTCSFAAGSQGAMPTALHAELHNPGHFAVEWSLILRTENQVDMENWVDLGEPPTERDQHEADVVENKILDCFPRGGVLEPGERTMVSLTYVHDFLGQHRLPMLLDVKHGKRVHVALVGRTLTDDEPLLEFLSESHTLAPVAVGVAQPPVQTYELRNVSATEISYVVDLTPLETLKNDNYGFKVLECLNPQGLVPPGGTALVKFRFHPIEAKEYTVNLPITIARGYTTVVAFSATGYHPLVDNSALLSTPGPSAYTSWPGFTLATAEGLESAVGKPMALSVAGLDLGDVPTRSLSRRLVMLTSHTPRPYAFSWSTGAAAALEGALSVEPAVGVIPPYGELMFKVVYQASGWPELVDVESRCELTPCPEALPPPPPSPSEVVLEAHGRHYTEASVRPARPARELVVHTHTASSAMKNPGLSLHPREPEGFHTQFNMAQATLSRTQAEAEGGAEPTVLVLGLMAAVQPEAQLESAASGKRAHFLTQKIKQPVRETCPPQLPPSDLQSVLSDMLLEVVCDPSVKAACSPASWQLGHERPMTFRQLVGKGGELVRPTPMHRAPAACELQQLGWEQALCEMAPRTMAAVLASYTTPVVSEESTAPEEEEEEEQVPEATGGKKKTPAELEAEAAARAEAKAAKRAAREAAAAAAKQAAEEAAARVREAKEAEAAAKAQRRAVAEAEAEAAEAAAEAARADLADERERAARRQRFAQTAECMQLAELVLEGTLFNLLKENHATHFML